MGQFPGIGVCFPVFEELGPPPTNSFRAVARDGRSVLVSWNLSCDDPLELRCRRDGDGTLKLIAIEEECGSTWVDLEPVGSTWELTLGTGGQAFRALLPSRRVLLRGITPPVYPSDSFARQ